MKKIKFTLLLLVCCCCWAMAQVTHPTTGSVTETLPAGSSTDYYDSGGAGGNYANFEDGSVTFCFDDGAAAQITFNVVDIEVAPDGLGAGGCYDFVTISDANGVLDAVACGEPGETTGTPATDLEPGATYTSSGADGCLTVTFTSDFSVSDVGWEATVSSASGLPDCNVTIENVTCNDGGTILFDNDDFIEFDLVGASGTFDVTVDGVLVTGSGVTYTTASGTAGGGDGTVVVTDGTCETVLTLPDTGTCSPLSWIWDIFIGDPCACNDDQSGNGAGDGTFSELVGITITDSNGDPITGVNVCVGIGSGIPLNTPFTDNGDGTYSLTFNHVDAVGYSIETIVDCDSGNLLLGTAGTILVANTCYYPVIDAPDAGTCDIFNIADHVSIANDGGDNPLGQDFNGAFAFTLDGEPVGDEIDAAGFSSGFYTIGVSYAAGNEVGISTDPNNAGCSVETSFTLSIAGSVVVCNNTVQVSVDEDCLVPVTPDMILEGAAGSDDCYTIRLYDGEGNELPGAVITDAEVGDTLSVHAVYNANGNYCWGNIIVEDKLNPTIECPCPADGVTGIEGALTADDDTYNRIFVDNIFGGGCILDGSATNVYYDALPLSVDADGEYTFAMMYSGDGTAALYAGSFDPNDPCTNLLEYNDDSNPNSSLDPLIITALMSAGDYVLVSSTYSNGSTGNYSWTFDGPGNVLARTGECSYTCLDLAGLLADSDDPIFIDAGTPVAEDNCNEPTLTYEDELTDNACDGQIIIRNWVATDASGNTAACAQEIYLRPLELSDIDPNGQVDIACDLLDDYPSPENLDAAGVEGAYPTITSEGFTYNVTQSLCNVGATYEDAPVADLCGGGYKIIRSWTLYNWCNAETALYTQVIKVEDNEGPVINTCPEYSEPIAASSVPNECIGIFVIQDLTDFTENCSEPTTVTVTVTMASGLIIDTQVGAQVQAGAGTHMVNYTITDACGNATTCDTPVTIEDLTPPVAICDEHTVAALGSDGNATICWETFDDGSYDNCEILAIKVKRMDADGDVQFTDCVDFDCADVQFDADGNPIPVMVRMRVYDVLPDGGFPDDESGRWNECMVEVEVQDKLNPLINCPEDKTVECQTEFAELDQIIPDDDGVEDADAIYPAVYYGGVFQGYYPGAYDNCIGVVDVTDEGDLDQCGEGTIYRTWLVTDAGGRTDVCTQIITVENSDPFEENDIDWPNDVSNGLECDEGTDPDDLPNGRQRPEFDEDTCDLVAVTYEDEYLPVVDSACYKILRYWTVIDWCQFDGATGAGVWTHIQVIKVKDNDEPTINSDLADVTVCTYTDGCIEDIDFSLDASDNCSDELDVHLFIDGYADGYVADVATIALPGGTHTVIWTVTDGCGNETVGQYDLTIEDCKQPTPVCLNGLATVVMPSSGEITLWASDFNAPNNSGSFDNCTEREDLLLFIRLVQPGNEVLTTLDEVLALETNVVFTCDNLGFPNVELYVVDEAGNWDYCTTYAHLQANDDSCLDPQGELADIAGYIETEYQEAVGQATVHLAGGSTAVNPFVTGNDGYYVFNGVAVGENYTITPEKDIDYLNGVTTYDLVLISKHILGIQALDSPYKIIAADANHSDHVTTFDIVQLRRLILNIDTELANNTSWRFVEKDYVFPDATNPFVTIFPEVASINSLEVDMMDTDFIGVKIGDVNGNAVPNQLLGTEDRNRANDLLFAVNDQTLTAGQQYTIDFTAKDFENILGYQFTLNFDKAAVEVLDVVPGTLRGISAANFGMNAISEGVITASWNDAQTVSMKDDAVIFSLDLVANAKTTVSEIFTINSTYTLAEAYSANEEMGVAIAFNAKDGSSIVGGQFELFQNQPNPFDKNTVIAFSLPQAGTATLTIFDVSGKVIRTSEGDFARGYNEILISRDELSATGMLYYRLESADYTATKKMIILE